MHAVVATSVIITTFTSSQTCTCLRTCSRTSVQQLSALTVSTRHIISHSLVFRGMRCWRRQALNFSWLPMLTCIYILNVVSRVCARVHARARVCVCVWLHCRCGLVKNTCRWLLIYVGAFSSFFTNKLRWCICIVNWLEDSCSYKCMLYMFRYARWCQHGQSPTCCG